ncbi:ATP-binding protein [Caulobacter mirabilis]|uniref:histidine kinase n=1 Tax=Caulobacter mirabilis TaxID=69666 RepID=A0A2D2B0D5_9CAUL|nr:ATP-binding protein [Caulobacter mirabilis]ATQ43703.1 hybrid sensor histidine kinase/response regulator [Caulobacter mirabilis]
MRVSRQVGSLSDGWSGGPLRGVDPATLRGLRRLVATVDGRLRVTSQVAVDLLGRQVRDVFPAQRTLDQYFPFEPLRSAMRTGVARALAGDPVSLDAHTDDGRGVSFALMPRYGGGGRQDGFFLMAEDRAVGDVDRARSRFLAAVSHELRTPMNGIFAVADILAGRPLPSADLELVEIMRRSGRDLLDLLNEIIDLSRIETGAMRLSRKAFSPRELLESLESVWTLAAYARGLDLRFSIEGAPERLVGDPVRIKQVLSNLLNNAIRFTPDGHVGLEARATPAGDGRVLLSLSVSDTGPGIDPELQDRLFDPFVTGGSSRVGPGLGLAISRELVGLMGGAIRAVSAPGGGARIVVDIELPEAEPTIAAAPLARRSGEVGRARVLVAEDHPVNRRVMALLLDHLGVEHEMVEDGEAAVAAALRGGIDLILMDLRMPRMDGIEATVAIRAAGLETPILAVTAEASAEEEAVMLAAGIDAVLPKPISLAGLAEALAVVMKRSEPVGA